MEDSEIVELYWERCETAITQTASKYGEYCRYISYSILHNREDAEECVSDTYLRAWNAMPQHRPNCLSAFLGKITRNLAFNRYKGYSAEKRGKGQIPLVLSELEDCLPSLSGMEQAIDERALSEAINRFLSVMPQRNRMLFIRRYWYTSPLKEIAQEYGMNENSVKSILFRERYRLKSFLEKEGIEL
ncbi:RNA polymerase sigma factor [Acetanaerobacterium elongatum]|uniref:RNA polymerase sigma-70 factor, ECF subfamily n=1 Tax=Acetanaerobacterium elongatum TaxID=258515 RepID=A0A1G9X9Q2_9FIRM|nr:sigma-70 family RNA polymerase sigma factor [Acetanaerobacterium elongatum]SDM93464.1 RNA polymerase sigma-70 factor, ECF subfamily [Acetanaerobacterium elongatum]